MAGKQNTEGFRVFRPTYKAHGRSGKSSRYHVSFKDHNRAWRRLVAFTDHGASIAYGRKLRALTDRRAAGEPPRGEIGEWVQGLPAEVLDKLIEWGVLDSRTAMITMPLESQLEEWEESIIAKGRTSKHAGTLRSRVGKIVDACGFVRYTDIDEAAIEAYFTRRRADEACGKRGERFSAQSEKHYVRAIRQFCAWMIRSKRASTSPVEGLEAPNVEAARRHVRRALTAEELRTLIQAAKDGEVWRGTTGAERAAIYALAVCTGLRANEIRSLTRDSFELDGDTPMVEVEAAASKHRRKDLLPLSTELVAMLRPHLSTKLPRARAFTVPDKTSTMVQRDLGAARAAWLKAAPTPRERAKRTKTDTLNITDGRGRVVDFHSLRMTFVTNLAIAGVHPAIAQRLARHSDIRLTMNTYTDVGYGDQREAVGSLPALALGGSA